MNNYLRISAGIASQAIPLMIQCSTFISVATPSRIHACSFGNLDKVSVGSSFKDILNMLYSGCGGTLSIERYCIGDCEESRRRYGQTFLLCTGNIRLGTPKCAVVANGKIISIERQTNF